MNTLSNKNFNLYFIKLRKLFIPSVIILFTLGLLLFSTNTIASARNGLKLWATSIVPSLFCFFVATDLLSHTFIIDYISRKLTKYIKPIFNIPGEGAFALIMGLLSGYPMGAKIICDYRDKGICTKVECERMLAFTNNSGPLFIIGTVGISIFSDSRTGLLLLITHILACLTVGFIFRFWKYSNSIYDFNYKKPNIKNNQYLSLNNFGEIISKSIINSINTILLIGGFVILFSVVISLIKNSGIFDIFRVLFGQKNIVPSYIEGTILGLFEITNGINLISSITSYSIINIIICSFLLGTGGLSVLLQVYSIISKTDISIKPYIYGKLLHGVIAALYTTIFLYAFPLFTPLCL